METSATSSSRALLVRVGGRDVALEARSTRGAALVEHVTPVPRSSEMLLGLIAVRGDIVPLVDLARLLGSATPEFVGRQAVVVETRGERFAFPVEDVFGFANVVPAHGALTAPPVEVGERVVEALSLDEALTALSERISLV
ncbi:chemotaxis protein CheW [Deinococcus yavapaiensis]|uniref:Purine-binding chemotaxis protein CheW n=1 Tax=Deinococcus yavapaiensis KR-236 TaxID=694435 RepID=A0A318SB36_9DEIO|nr:chemotaxis protein CheW [Deinococcus yavapaiensis]PYE56640.1 purine-binding chemotaxis protein CheW [Deinococcus yavapaiensis KR-236]